MLKLRGIVIFLLLSVFLAGCHQPFISVEVRTGGEMVAPKSASNDPEAGCFWPFVACPGVLNTGKVVMKTESGPITFYRIKVDKNYRNISAPPTVVEGTIEEGNTVEISISDDGTMTMKKAI